MTVTTTFITIADDSGTERTVAVRGDTFGRGAPHLDRFMRARGLHVTNIEQYCQPTFAQNVKFFETGWPFDGC